MKDILRTILSSDAQADRIVPPSGFTALLTLFAAGAMAFLAVFALALSFSVGRLANDWGRDLAGSATVRIMAPPGEQLAQTEAALAVLSTASGIVSAEAMTPQAQSELLAPWLGTGPELEGLPMPQLITLSIDPARFDAAGLRLRLAAEVPGAVLDDHGRWRAPLVAAAGRLRALGWGTAILITAVVATIVTLAAQAALAANAQVIAVLRLVGATDSYIALAFVRRFTQRAALGGLAGTIIGALVLWLLPTSTRDEAPGLLTSLGLQGAEWIVLLLVPLLIGLVALIATRRAAGRMLRSLT